MARSTSPLAARIKRRTFLMQSAGVGMALTLSSARAASVNEQLNLGFIGVGGRGNELMRQFGLLADVRIGALCDPDKKRLKEAADKHPHAATYDDLRELLNDEKIDAVVIATCNHWHALATIWACQAGKHVYVEKPLAHNHWEGQQVVRAAERYGRIVQVGTQQRSDPLQDELKDFLHDQQALGPIQIAQVCRFGAREPIGKRSTPLALPRSVNYDLWLGPARDQPIYRNQLHYDWHWDWNTGNGEMGNWGVHVIDDAINVVLRDRAAFPKRIAIGGGRVAWDDAGQTPNVCFVYYDTGDVPLLYAMSNLIEKSNGQALRIDGIESGYIIHCAGGYYAGGRGKGVAYDANGNVVRRFKGDAGEKHPRNFVDAIYSGDASRLNSSAVIGHQSTAWCTLADIALRIGKPYSHEEAKAMGQPHESWDELLELFERHLSNNSVDAAAHLRLSPTLEFDSGRQVFIGESSVAANRLLQREYRAKFKVPTVA